MTDSRPAFDLLDLRVLSLVGVVLQSLLALVHASTLALGRRSGRLRIGGDWLASQLALLTALLAVIARNALLAVEETATIALIQRLLICVYVSGKLGFFTSVALGTAELIGVVPTVLVRRVAWTAIGVLGLATSIATADLITALPVQGLFGVMVMGAVGVALLRVPASERSIGTTLLGITGGAYALLGLTFLFGWRYIAEGLSGSFWSHVVLVVDRASIPDLVAQFMMGLSTVALLFEQQRALSRQTGMQGRALQQEAVTTERLETLGRVAATVAHELNNPLSVVLGITEQLLAQAPAPQLRDDLDLMHREAARCRHVARELLLFSRDARPALDRCDADAVLLPAVASVRLQAAAAGVLLVVREAEHFDLQAEEIALQQVLINLLRNAIDGTPRGRQVWASVTREEHEAVFVVEDEGAGMPPESLSEGEELFFTTKPAGEGTGLGLAIVRGIVHRHGGRLDIETMPARRVGTRVTVRIPRVAADPRPSDAATAALLLPTGVAADRAPGALDLAQMRSQHVLVVDDEVGIRRVMSRLLGNYGLQVTVAGDGIEARARLAERAPEDWAAIFCDIRMPRESGLVFLEHLERTAPALLPQLVLLTGDTVSETVVAATARTHCRLLAKPFRQRDVEQVLQEIWSGPAVMQLS